jgi:hypothetical protein
MVFADGSADAARDQWRSEDGLPEAKSTKDLWKGSAWFFQAGTEGGEPGPVRRRLQGKTAESTQELDIMR